MMPFIVIKEIIKKWTMTNAFMMVWWQQWATMEDVIPKSSHFYGVHVCGCILYICIPLYLI